MATVDTLLVKIEADMSGLRRDLNKVQSNVKKTTGGMTKAFKAAGGAAALYLGARMVATVAGAAKSLVDLAGDIDEMQSKSSVVFGAFTADIRGFAEEFGSAVGRSKFQLEEMASTVQDTFVPMGFARGEAAELSKQLTVLAVDVASFNNAQDMDTMKAFQSALVGNHETVRRFGIVITEATLDQELMTMGITKGAQAASNAQKVQARLNLIVKGTTDAQGDAARTAGSYANQVKGLESSWEMFRAELGRLLIGPGLGVVIWLKDTIQGVRELAQAMGLLDTTSEDLLSGAEQSLTKFNEKIKEQEAVVQRMQSGMFSGITPQFAIDKQIELLKGLKEQARQQEVIIHNAKEGKRFQKEESTAHLQSLRDIEDARVKTQAQNKKQVAEAQKAAQARKDLIADLKFENEQQGVLNDSLTLDADARRKITDQLEMQAILRDANIQGYTAEGQAIISALEKKYALIRTNDKITEQQEAQKKARDDLAAEEERGVKKYTDMAKAATSATEKYKQQILDLTLAKIKYGDAIPDITEALERLKQKQFESTEAGKMAMEVTGSISKSVSQGIADVLTNTGSGFKDFKQSMISTLNSVIQKMIEAKIQAVLMGKAMSMSGGGGGGGFSLGSIFEGIGSFFGGGSSSSQFNFGAFAGGGRVSGPTVVGERGPELFIPNSVGSIMNNSNSKNMVSGGGEVVINQTINVTTGVQQTVRAEIMDMMPIIEAKTNQAVIDARSRGGSFASALVG